MQEIFSECRRVLKPEGLMTLMFTHTSQEAWEALTLSLIESRWEITSSLPVESESEYSTHQMNQAAAASSIFLTCRKREEEQQFPSSWTGFGGTGVQKQIQEAVLQGLRDFAVLEL